MRFTSQHTLSYFPKFQRGLKQRIINENILELPESFRLFRV